MLKKCNKCQAEKPANDFYANRRMKDGLNTFCILCHKLDNVTRKKKNRADENFALTEKTNAKKNRLPKLAFYNELTRLWRKNNSEYVKSYAKNYRQQNKQYLNFLCQKRKISLLHRTPSWLTEDDLWMMEEIYKFAAYRTQYFGFAWHVDHIVPLRGKIVSGLHVPANLQVVPWIDNQRKTNKFEVLNA